jgi:hypothetical protein
MFSLGLLSVDWFIVWNFQVAALNFGDFYNIQYVKMYNFFMVQLQVQWGILVQIWELQPNWDMRINLYNCDICF